MFEDLNCKFPVFLCFSDSYNNIYMQHSGRRPQTKHFFEITLLIYRVAPRNYLTKKNTSVIISL